MPSSESQEKEFDINNQLGMEGSENNTMESEVNANPSEEINHSRAWGQESEPREMISICLWKKDENCMQNEENRMEKGMKNKENKMKKGMKNKENILKK